MIKLSCIESFLKKKIPVIYWDIWLGASLVANMLAEISVTLAQQFSGL